MNVAQLIAHLRKLDASLEVWIQGEDRYGESVLEKGNIVEATVFNFPEHHPNKMDQLWPGLDAPERFINQRRVIAFVPWTDDERKPDPDQLAVNQPLLDNSGTGLVLPEGKSVQFKAGPDR